MDIRERNPSGFICRASVRKGQGRPPGTQSAKRVLLEGLPGCRFYVTCTERAWDLGNGSVAEPLMNCALS